MKTILVTGGAGFIGANFIRLARQQRWAKIINLDKLTYAGNLLSLKDLAVDPDYSFVPGDIGNQELVSYLLQRDRPQAIINFAAESHVDRSISNPEQFIQTNVIGTLRLLETSHRYFANLPADQQQNFRFLHISTDEVFGSLNPYDPPFAETTAYAPNSPYAASKAAADHLVRAYHHTYGLPTLTTNCSNNYGPYQFPEKLIPLVILNALEFKPIPVYGQGTNVRDWLYVTDHCEGIYRVLELGKVGETYNIGGRNQQTNLEVVLAICKLLDQFQPQPGSDRASLITYVQDRPGHDLRYAINCDKIEEELGWLPQESFETGLAKTVKWYLTNPDWVDSVKTGSYRQWLEQNYAHRPKV
ncbi:MAG: dTDP-glucose 4,6-dehydratase [Pseudanabaenaceae cyanobacterium bins.68]|nr:dTDP-glucose 4,6-dehydratase [Pseudanabaenaceae cyanobacterium bins.68]